MGQDIVEHTSFEAILGVPESHNYERGLRLLDVACGWCSFKEAPWRSRQQQEAYSFLGMLIGRFSNYLHRYEDPVLLSKEVLKGAHKGEEAEVTLHIATINIPRMSESLQLSR